MITEQILLNIYNEKFKTSCINIKKAIKISKTMFSFPTLTLRQKKIKVFKLNSQIERNLQLISEFEKNHFNYINNLSSVHNQTKESSQRSNLSKRKKRANVTFESLFIELYRVNINWGIENNIATTDLNQELNKRKQEDAQNFLSEYEQDL